jgi:ATP synthase protein I
MPLIPPEQMRAIGALSTVGLSFVIAIVLGTAAGYWLDRTFGTAPLLFIVFFFLGVIAGALNVYRATRPYIK